MHFSRACVKRLFGQHSHKTVHHMTVTAKDVAVQAGVSTSAVSRCFTDGASISPKTRAKVETAAKALGYQPNLMARSLITGRTELVGLVSNNFNNPAFMEIFDLFTRHLQSRGLRPLLVNLSGSPDAENGIAMLRQYQVDGVIIASSTVSADFITGCRAFGIPMVHAFGSKGDVSVVSADNVQGGRLAAEVLVQRGYQRIAFLGGPQAASSTVDRLRGFRAGLKAAGLAPQVEMFAPSYSHEAGMLGMLELLDAAPVDAVFCGDDILAMGAMDACRQRGFDVPRKIGLLGFNDIAMASWPAYNLSTIRQPIAKIIVEAVEVCIDLVANTSAPVTTKKFKCEAVLRGSLRS
jgi:DNA-binding LacI/PurR family transcriptional regulator